MLRKFPFLRHSGASSTSSSSSLHQKTKKFFSVFSSSSSTTKKNRLSTFLFNSGLTLFALWFSYEIYYVFFFRDPFYDFFRRQYFFKVKKNLLAPDKDDPNLLEQAGLMEREHFFRRLTRFDDTLPHATFRFFSTPANPLFHRYKDLRNALVLHFRDRDSAFTSHQSLQATTSNNGQFLEGPKSWKDLIPLPHFIFGERAFKNSVYRNAIWGYVFLEGKKLNVDLPPKKTDLTEKEHIDSILNQATSKNNTPPEKQEETQNKKKIVLSFSSTKSARDRILENTIVWNHPWLLAAETERVALDFYSGRFLLSPSFSWILPTTLAKFAQKYFFEVSYGDYITKMRICFLQRSMKSVTQLWHLKGGSAELDMENVLTTNPKIKKRMLTMIEEENKLLDKNNHNDEQGKITLLAPKWSFDGYSRLKALLFIRKLLHDEARTTTANDTTNRRIQYDRETMNLTLDRALLYAQFRIGSSLSTKHQIERNKKSTYPSFLPEHLASTLFGDRWENQIKKSANDFILDSICQRLKRGEVVPVATGTSTHSICMLLAPNFTVVSNRGSGAGGSDRFGFSVYSHDDHHKHKPYYIEALENKESDSRKYLSKIVLGGLKKEDLIAPTVNKDSSDGSNNNNSNDKRMEEEDVSTKIPKFLTHLIPSSSNKYDNTKNINNRNAIKLEGVVRMRKQIAGDCSFESSAKPLMHIGLALSLARKNHPENIDNNDNDHNNKLPTPPSGASFIHLLRQASPRYFRLASHIKHTQLVEYLKHQEEQFPHYYYHQHQQDQDNNNNNNQEKLLPYHHFLRIPDMNAHNRIVEGVLKQMSSRPSNLTPNEASIVVDAILRDFRDTKMSKVSKQNEDDKEKIQREQRLQDIYTNQLIHFAAMSGCIEKVEELKQGRNKKSGVSSKHQNSFRDSQLHHDESLLTPSSSLSKNTTTKNKTTLGSSSSDRKHLSSFEAVEQLVNLRKMSGGIFEYGMSCVPSVKDLEQCLKSVA